MRHWKFQELIIIQKQKHSRVSSKNLVLTIQIILTQNILIWNWIGSRKISYQIKLLLSNKKQNMVILSFFQSLLETELKSSQQWKFLQIYQFCNKIIKVKSVLLLHLPLHWTTLDFIMKLHSLLNFVMNFIQKRKVLSNHESNY